MVVELRLVNQNVAGCCFVSPTAMRHCLVWERPLTLVYLLLWPRFTRCDGSARQKTCKENPPKRMLFVGVVRPGLINNTDVLVAGVRFRCCSYHRYGEMSWYRGKEKKNVTSWPAYCSKTSNCCFLIINGRTNIKFSCFELFRYAAQQNLLADNYAESENAGQTSTRRRFQFYAHSRNCIRHHVTIRQIWIA